MNCDKISLKKYKSARKIIITFTCVKAVFTLGKVESNERVVGAAKRKSSNMERHTTAEYCNASGLCYSVQCVVGNWQVNYSLHLCTLANWHKQMQRCSQSNCNVIVNLPSSTPDLISFITFCFTLVKLNTVVYLFTPQGKPNMKTVVFAMN